MGFVDKLYELLRKIVFFLLPTSGMRTKYIYKHNVFRGCGQKLFWQPRKLPSDPQCIKFHNNVKVAADVKFVCHDVIYLLTNDMDPSKRHVQFLDCIEVMDNVFIGMGAMILPGVKIGSNVIVAAGAVVTKDVPDDSIVGGCPAKIIGRTEEFLKKRYEYSNLAEFSARYDQKRIDEVWRCFEEKHQ